VSPNETIARAWQIFSRQSPSLTGQLTLSASEVLALKDALAEAERADFWRRNSQELERALLHHEDGGDVTIADELLTRETG